MKAEMVRVGWNDEQVAVLTGVRVKSIERWRRGEHQPHLNNVKALATAFDRPVEFFYASELREAA